MPIVRVEIARGVASVEQKKAVIRRMTEVLVEELGRDPDYVFVLIDEVDTDNWGRKGRSLTDLWGEREG
ncbi:4-oxalocrotonate tautomerase family protein [Rubellimicrobium rubrum]|uniref:Tautomerase n=1 Tax=Rubellimicrobium rubrum TaxID=2585369 RepID=A0A5C4MY54_9RHOB|nr:4-oxalocrotonate tautomerase family protein [Rubellimicrobium rubrum]TNC49371.1 4-oxalocrotonate tautomerase family protein [Rubellimicrobium rubrum]